MAYGIINVKGGYLVSNPVNHRVYSSHPLPLKTARKQRVAIALSEARKTRKPIKSFFV